MPNKYPALTPSTGPDPRALGPMFREMGGYGAHEVVIESPDHARYPAQHSLDQVERVLQVLHARFLALMADPRLRAIVIFKNHGERAGTSLSHPHWQVIATPVVPRLHRTLHQIATDYFDSTSRCLYCVMAEEELRVGTRVLTRNDHFVALLPYASHVPYEIRVLPLLHRSSFSQLTAGEIRPLAQVLTEVLQRLDAALDDPDFNLTVVTAPLGDEEKRYFLWHIDVLPRLTTPAGFELGSGMSINSVLPEVATDHLRSVAIDDRPPAMP